MMNSHRLKIQLLCVCSLFLASATHTSVDIDTLTKIHREVTKIAHGKNKAISILSAIVVAETAYILNDIDPNGIVTDLKEKARTFIEQNMPRKKENGSSEVATESSKADSESNSN